MPENPLKLLTAQDIGGMPANGAIPQLDVASLEDPSMAEPEGGVGALQQILSQAVGGDVSDIPAPKYADIQSKRKMLDDALQKIIQQRQQRFAGPSMEAVTKAGYNPFANLGDQMQYFGGLKKSQRDDAVFNEERALAPMQMDADRIKLQHDFLTGDRDAYLKQQAYKMDNLLKMLTVAQASQPSFRSTKITNADGSTQTALYDPKDPNSIHPVGAPTKASANASILKQYNEFGDQVAAYEGAADAREKVLELAGSFPAITMPGAGLRADVDQATGGKIPGLFGGDSTSSKNYNEYLSYVSDTILSMAEKMKGALSDKDIGFLKESGGGIKLDPEKRAARLRSIFKKLDSQYSYAKNRMNFYDSKYNLADVAQQVNESGLAVPLGMATDMTDDELLQEYQDLHGAIQQ